MGFMFREGQDMVRQPACFRAEDQGVVGGEGETMNRSAAFAAGHDPAFARPRAIGVRGKIGPGCNADMWPIVEAGAFQVSVLKRKAEWLDEVQLCARGSAEPSHVAGVGWDFGFKKDDMHGAHNT